MKLFRFFCLFTCLHSYRPLANECFTLYRNLLEERLNTVEQGLLNEQDRRELARIFSDLTHDTAVSLKEAHELFLDAQLRSLSPEVQQRVRQTIQNTVFLKALTNEGWLSQAIGSWVDADGMDYSLSSANYNPIENIIKIWTTDRYKGAPFTLMFHVHEIEHAVWNQLRIESGITNEQYLRIHQSSASAALMFIEEKKSMLAEWEWLHSVPVQIRDEAARELKADPSVHRSQKKWILRTMVWAALPAHEYLKHQYSIGRYTLKAIQSNSALTGMGWFVTHEGFRWKCDELSISEAWQYVCSRRFSGET